ncbi:hypothetical protein KA005_06130, partial [bacterium]|nr:hypothetical protein [bacterium]
MKYHPILAWGIWFVMVIGLVIIGFYRFESLISGKTAISDLFLILLFVALLLAPMFSQIDLFGLKLLHEIRRDVDEVKSQVNTLSTNIQSKIQVINVTDGMAQLSDKPAEQEVRSTTSLKAETRSPMEYKILKTFWTKQVNRYDKWLDSAVWTFRINSAYPATPEFLRWREAATKLIVEGLAMEAENGQIYLTPEGFEYCKEHYEEFGVDEYWP